ncbi:hypothetical protein TNCV_4925811 [Trichonephila clavipes]|nr:hypothetical protein TNCV_4925811 [Trichonephila clavipes]
MLEKVIENWTSRLDYIRASRGSPIPEIIFTILAPIASLECIDESSATSDGSRTLPPSRQISLSAATGIRYNPTENSLAVLNHEILEANSQVKNVKLGGHQTCLSINRLWQELCDMFAVLLKPQLLDIMIVQFRNEKLVIMAL